MSGAVVTWFNGLTGLAGFSGLTGLVGFTGFVTDKTQVSADTVQSLQDGCPYGSGHVDVLILVIWPM